MSGLNALFNAQKESGFKPTVESGVGLELKGWKIDICE